VQKITVIKHSLRYFVYVYVVAYEIISIRLGMWLGNEETAMRNVQITKTGAGFICVSCIIIFYVSYKYSSAIWPSNDETVDMHQLLAVSAQLAKLAGDRAWSIHKEQHSNLEAVVKGKTKEGANEMLTRGDMESHRIMRFGLEKTFPGLKVLCCHCY